ncbi:MAG: hypothetical protein S4CHLAM20_03640 [Chlamydiia bacterium]|nr:hypothetical protein [Chlamydiia bacterium]
MASQSVLSTTVCTQPQNLHNSQEAPPKITTLSKGARKSAEKVTQATDGAAPSLQCDSSNREKILEKLRSLNGDNTDYAYHPLFRELVSWEEPAIKDFWSKLHQNEKKKRAEKKGSTFIELDRNLKPLTEQVSELNNKIYIGALLFGEDRILVFVSVNHEEAVRINKKKLPIQTQCQFTSNFKHLNRHGINPERYRVYIDTCIQIKQADPKKGNLIFSSMGKKEFFHEPIDRYFMLTASVSYNGAPYYAFMGMRVDEFNRLQGYKRTLNLPALQCVYEWDSEKEEMRQLIFSDPIKYGDEYSLDEFRVKCQNLNAFAFEDDSDRPPAIGGGSKDSSLSISQGSAKPNSVFVVNENLPKVLNNSALESLSEKTEALDAHADKLDPNQTKAIYVNRNLDISTVTKRNRYKKYQIGKVIIGSVEIPVVVLCKKKIEEVSPEPIFVSMDSPSQESTMTFKADKDGKDSSADLKLCYIFEPLAQFVKLSSIRRRSVIKSIGAAAKEAYLQDPAKQIVVISQNYETTTSALDVTDSMVSVGSIKIEDRKFIVMKEISENERALLNMCSGFNDSANFKKYNVDFKELDKLPDLAEAFDFNIEKLKEVVEKSLPNIIAENGNSLALFVSRDLSCVSTRPAIGCLVQIYEINCSNITFRVFMGFPHDEFTKKVGSIELGEVYLVGEQEVAELDFTSSKSKSRLVGTKTREEFISTFKLPNKSTIFQAFMKKSATKHSEKRDLHIVDSSYQLLRSYSERERKELWERVTNRAELIMKKGGTKIVISSDCKTLSEEWDQNTPICILASINTSRQKVLVLKKMSLAEVKSYPELVANERYQNGQFNFEFKKETKEEVFSTEASFHAKAISRAKEKVFGSSEGRQMVQKPKEMGVFIAVYYLECREHQKRASQNEFFKIVVSSYITSNTIIKEDVPEIKALYLETIKKLESREEGPETDAFIKSLIEDAKKPKSLKDIEHEMQVAAALKASEKATYEKQKRLKRLARRHAEQIIASKEAGQALLSKPTTSQSNPKALDDEELLALFKEDNSRKKTAPRTLTSAQKRERKRLKDKERQKKKNEAVAQKRREMAEMQRAKDLAFNQQKAEKLAALKEEREKQAVIRQQEAELEKIAEAKVKAEAEAERKAVEELERKAEAEAKQKAAEEAKQKAEAEAKQKAEAEVKRKAEAEAKRKAVEAAKQKAEAERKAVEEAKQKAEAERKAAEEAERKAVEAESKATESKAAEADAIIQAALQNAVLGRARAIDQRIENVSRRIGEFGELSLQNINQIMDLERRKTFYLKLKSNDWSLPIDEIFEWTTAYSFLIINDSELKKRLDEFNQKRTDLLIIQSHSELQNLDMSTMEGASRSKDLNRFIIGLGILKKEKKESETINQFSDLPPYIQKNVREITSFMDTPIDSKK